MPAVDNQQITQLWDAYADNNFCFENSQGNVLHAEEADEQRRERLPLLQDHLDDFVRGETELKEFKSEIDSQNKQYPFWGFKGMNGMMFFNMIHKSAGDERQSELATLLREVLLPPDNTAETKEKIRSIEGFVEQLRNEADDLRKAPRLGSIPYFISYFWQIADPDTYPIYYTSMVRVLSDLAIWEPSDDLAASYVEFWDLNEEIRGVLTDYVDQEIHLWTIEHAFWYWQQRDEFENEPETVSDSRQTTLPDSYIPPIVSILPKLARNTDEIRELAGETGQSVETLFENRLAKCLRMLGFEVDELGQGAGGILMELRKIDCTIMQLSTMRKFEAMAIASGLVTNGSSKTTSIGKSLRFVLTDSGTSISP